MRTESRIELKIIVPIILFLMGQAGLVFAWGSGIQERVGKLETSSGLQSAQLERIETKLDKMNENILDLTRELSQ